MAYQAPVITTPASLQVFGVSPSIFVRSSTEVYRAGSDAYTLWEFSRNGINWLPQVLDGGLTYSKSWGVADAGLWYVRCRADTVDGDVSEYSASVKFYFANVATENGVVTGGEISISGLYTIHKFSSNGVFKITPSGFSLRAEVLVVAGGGGWNYGSENLYFGGGGAGGLRYMPEVIVSGENSIVVGAAGRSYAPWPTAPAENGGNSSAFGYAAQGGGKGGDGPGSAGSAGGSGGGGGSGYSAPGGVGGSGESGQGYNGSNGGDYRQGGCGGGAGGVGSREYGGDGIASSISGVSLIYSTGGNGDIANEHYYPLPCNYGGGAGNFPYNQPIQQRGAQAGIVYIKYLTSDLSGATKLTFKQQPTDALVNSAITPDITIQLQNESGDNVFQSGISITITKRTGTGTLSGTLTQSTNASGLATFSDLSINLAGSKNLTVVSSGLTSAISNSFIIGGEPPPIANFTAAPREFFESKSVQFTDLSTGTPTSWSWKKRASGSDSTFVEFSTTQNPTETFSL